MNLIKTSAALAVAAGLAAPAFALEPITVYGKINTSVQSADDKGTDGSEVELKSNASRFGIKGGAAVNDSLDVIYTLEFQVNIADSEGDNIDARNQWVGIQGDFGQLLVGRNDTMLKQSQGKVDLFGDLDADIKSLFEGENRLDQTVTYKSPKYNGFQFGVTYATENSNKQNDETGFSTAVMYGDSSLKKSNFYASVAYDSEIDAHDVIRGTIQGKVGNFVLGAMVQNEEPVDGDDDYTGYMASVAYNMNAWTFKAQYQTMEEASADPTSISLGADYKLAKPTKLFAYATLRDLDKDATNDAGKTIDEETYVGLGIEHKF
ncbi:porin [Neiella marina]|uniref:Porin n=1 Tax=Neiella holothuriorum TaxID=2870530 RepID=A0ABS7EK50_9GAMM|nr:porin [Neiella holothuriorum]MBW8192706.1 porin [Neiella holothuriorum]